MNRFIKYAEDYLDLLTSIIKFYNSKRIKLNKIDDEEVNDNKFHLFKKSKEKESKPEIDSIYEDADKYIRNHPAIQDYVEINEADKLLIIREFIEFLDFANYTLIRDKNDKDIVVLVDKEHSSEVLIYNDIDRNIQYRISFLETLITKMPVNKNRISMFINNEKEEYETLVQIDIIRDPFDNNKNKEEFTHSYDAEFKFLIDSNIDSFLRKDEDKFLYKVFSKIIIDMIKKEFDTIIENINNIFEPEEIDVIRKVFRLYGIFQ